MKKGPQFDHFSPKRFRGLRRRRHGRISRFDGGRRFPSWAPTLDCWWRQFSSWGDVRKEKGEKGGRSSQG